MIGMIVVVRGCSVVPLRCCCLPKDKWGRLTAATQFYLATTAAGSSFTAGSGSSAGSLLLADQVMEYFYKRIPFNTIRDSL
jgi:hypothetical protein